MRRYVGCGDASSRRRCAMADSYKRRQRQDLTERKRMEEALQNSEDKYRTLVETTATGYLIIDSDGKVLDANAEYVRLTGHKTLQEILGRSVTEWTAPH